MAPYTKKEQSNHKHYDSLYWEILLNSKEISTLYIYTKDKGFFRNNTHSQGLHPLLIQEWSILKKGELKLYIHNEQDKKFCPQEAQEDFSEMQQEAYPSFYAGKVLERENLGWFPPRAHEITIERLFSEIQDTMDRGLDYETEDLFEELFYRIKSVQKRGYLVHKSDNMMLRAQMLYDKYRNMW